MEMYDASFISRIAGGDLITIEQTIIGIISLPTRTATEVLLQAQVFTYCISKVT